MKVLPFKIPKPENVTLYIQQDKGKTFYDKLHQHKEFQISVILKGEGTFVIGDCVGDFVPNDVFVLGENLPHVFKSDLSTEKNTSMISIFFSRNSFGTDFFDLPEFDHLQPFLNDAVLGLKILSNKEQFESLFLNIESADKFDLFLKFLTILDLISKSKRQTLSSLINLKKYGGNEGKRMSDIFQYTMNNFHREISLSDVANIANMTPNAFCRFFKQRTTKTFVNFLIDIRIGNACKLLSKKNDLSITEISYRSGFNNLANFNRKFKTIKGVTPSEYRKSHI